MKQSELGCDFARNATRGSASNLQIVETDNGAALVGYGHAVYFERAFGVIKKYADWRGYSPSTSAQMTRLERGILQAGESMESVDERKRLNELEL